MTWQLYLTLVAMAVATGAYHDALRKWYRPRVIERRLEALRNAREAREWAREWQLGKIKVSQMLDHMFTFTAETDEYSIATKKAVLRAQAFIDVYGDRG